MTSEEFIALGKDNKLTERCGAQAHFDDLCDLLGVDIFVSADARQCVAAAQAGLRVIQA